MPGYTDNIPEGTARTAMYAIGGAPTAWFDGFYESVGGLPSGTMFSYYNPLVSSQLSVPSPLEISATYHTVGLEVTLDVRISVTDSISPNDYQAHFIVCEDGAHDDQSNLARLAMAYEPFTLTDIGQWVDIQRTATLNPAWTGPINIVVFVQNHGTNTDVLQAALASEEWFGDTVGVTFACTPSFGTLPFTTGMWAGLENLTPYTRRISGKIDVLTAGGSFFSNWRAGWTNLSPYEDYTANWNQSLPGIGSLVGSNIFIFYGSDVTPAPYNQPPYAPDGDMDTAACTVTGMAP